MKNKNLLQTKATWPHWVEDEIDTKANDWDDNFFAGVWAHHAQQMKNILDAGDIEEALNAANAIGDDRLQKQAQGYVVPDAFTHGTSEQRMRWFKKGFDTGDINQGDTFGANP